MAKFNEKDFSESFKVTLSIDFGDLYKFSNYHGDDWKDDEKPTKKELTESIISEIISWLSDLKFDVAVELDKE